MSAAIQRLLAVSYMVKKMKHSLALDPIVVGLIALAAIPTKWEYLIPIICTSYELEDLTIGTVCDQVVTQYENEVNHGGHKQLCKQTNPANAHKISAVKWKCGNPRFSQQDCSQQLQAGPSNPNQQQSNRQCSGRGSRHGGKSKGKGKAAFTCRLHHSFCCTSLHSGCGTPTSIFLYHHLFWAIRLYDVADCLSVAIHNMG